LRKGCATLGAPGRGELLIYGNAAAYAGEERASSASSLRWPQLAGGPWWIMFCSDRDPVGRAVYERFGQTAVPSRSAEEGNPRERTDGHH